MRVDGAARTQRWEFHIHYFIETNDIEEKGKAGRNIARKGENRRTAKEDKVYDRQNK